MAIRTIIPLILLSLAAAACDIQVGKDGGLSLDISEGKANDEWKRTYTVAPGGAFEVINRVGDIKVYAATGGAVEVLALRQLGSRSPEESQAALKQLQMIEEIAPDRVLVRTPDSQPEGGKRYKFLFVEYRIGLPPGLTITLKTENGQVKVENVQGSVTASTTNGELTLTGVSGPVDAQTVNGGVNVEVKALSGGLKLGAVNGGIRVSLPPGADADLELSAVNGGVSVDDALTLTATQTKERQSIRGRLGKGGTKIAAQVVNGGVRVRALPAAGR
jgi:hypothetical protein